MDESQYLLEEMVDRYATLRDEIASAYLDAQEARGTWQDVVMTMMNRPTPVSQSEFESARREYQKAQAVVAALKPLYDLSQK